MAFRPPLSAIVITLNEEANLPRCLASLHWAQEVIVVDSGSEDSTQEIASRMGAKVLENPWKGYGQQKNWALARASHDWVLFLDADEEVSPALRQELEHFLEAKGVMQGQQYWGASVPRKTWYLGRWILHGGWYPNRLVRLAHKSRGKWTEPAVHEELLVDGASWPLRADLHHFTFRTVGEQVQTNVRFARLGAAVARERGQTGSLLRMLLKPVGKFLETYLWKRGFLDGVPGLVISINAAHSVFMKYAELRFEKNSAHR
jgi:glycosyltransferase involved in cell wall biosynthesis